MSWFTDPFDNLWNDVAGALYSHPISDTNIFAMNLLAVMQGGTGYRHTTNFDGPHQGDRSQHPTPSDLDSDLLYPGFFTARHEFVRDRPPRMMRG
jgi:hypothetical protein